MRERKKNKVIDTKEREEEWTNKKKRGEKIVKQSDEWKSFTNFDFLFVKIQFICLSIKASTSNYKVPTNLHPTFFGILANIWVWGVAGCACICSYITRFSHCLSIRFLCCLSMHTRQSYTNSTLVVEFLNCGKLTDMMHIYAIVP